ncbi:MAG TPA: hypothetical protein VK995_04805, partial [Oceanipulchritudo sp.]|nr:hypothetical protein [Oceanipulchritudo sp.]
GQKLVQAQLTGAKTSAPVITEAIESPSTSVSLRLEMRDGVCRFFYAGEDGFFRPIGEGLRARDADWMGARIGLISLNPGMEPSGGSVLYANFNYNPLN